MTQYLDFIVGAALLFAGYLGGRIHRPRQTSTAPRPVCACKHTLGEHDENGKCRADMLRNGTFGREWVPCACIRYVGPKPVEDLFAQTYLPPTEDA